MEVVGAADHESTALDIYSRNLKPRRRIAGNLFQSFDFNVAGRGSGAQFSGRPVALDSDLRSLEHGVDLLIGGPPCQGLSSANNFTRSDDP